MRKAKRKFFRGLKTPNSKNFWKVAKFLTKKNSTISTLKNEERVVENEATLLNSYFSHAMFQSICLSTN